MELQTLQPVQQSKRTAIVDMLRGWALLGVVLMNYVDYFYLGLDFEKWKPHISESILQGIGQVVFAAKSWTMLSFLFGYGFAILMRNVKAKGLNAFGFFSRRMFLLFVLAIINSALFFGDILKDYAVMGMVLLMFHRCSAKVVFTISMALLLLSGVVMPLVARLGNVNGMESLTPHVNLFYSHNIFKVLWFGLVGTYKFEIINPTYLITIHIVMLGCFFLGLAAQKIDFFNRIIENKKYVKRIFWGTLIFALLMVGIFILTNAMKWKWMQDYYQPAFLFIISSMLFIASTLCWLYVAGKLKAFFKSMQTIGKMTLTNYMTQNLLAIFLFSGFGFGFAEHKIHLGYYLLFGLVIYIIQIYFSKWWLSKYKYGPIEWVWRQLSYAKRLPIKREKNDLDF